jgi:DNA-binding FrmR family transcriptional regulator
VVSGSAVRGQREQAAVIRHARRASGQTAAIAPMIEADLPFSAVVQHLLAARGWLDSLLMRLVELNLSDRIGDPEDCVAITRMLETAILRSGSARRTQARRDAG